MNSNDRWIWLGLSVGLAVLTGLLRAFLLYMAREREDHPLFQQIKRFVEHPWLVHSLRLLYAVGLPALALFFSGALTTRGLGLKPLPPAGARYGWLTSWPEWAADSGWMLLIALVTIALIRIGDDDTRRATGYRVTYKHDLGIAIREAVYYQAHWAFYREPFIVMAGWQTGAVMGLLPVILERLLNPDVWQREFPSDKRRELAIRLGILGASALLYMLTQNIWVSVLMDVAVTWAVHAEECES